MGLSRRGFLRGAAVGGGLLLASGGVGVRDAAAQEGSGDDPYAPAVDAGLEYFRRRAADQIPLVEELVRAIASGDYYAATSAYVNARPPYEEIEVHAGSFEQTDSDIDARPYSFDEGETSEEFKGYHRIEALLYRDCDLGGALPYAEELLESAKTLQEDLEKRENFTSGSHFEGMIALSTEVPSKKISSEEETYSDQSLLIFSQNWRGIYSQFQTFQAEVESRSAGAGVAVEDAYHAAQGLLEHHFASGSYFGTPYSSVGISERGGIVRASYGLRDSLLKAQEVLGLV